ncbi:MAG: hypothetical protein Fur0010_27410 [Bdellovibrio sp.]
MSACLKCKHYYVTFDSQNPRGCRLFGFKSAQIPSVVIKRETGEDCQEFEAKVAKGEAERKAVDFNDPKYWS